MKDVDEVQEVKEKRSSVQREATPILYLLDLLKFLHLPPQYPLGRANVSMYAPLRGESSHT